MIWRLQSRPYIVSNMAHPLQKFLVFEVRISYVYYQIPICMYDAQTNGSLFIRDNASYLSDYAPLYASLLLTVEHPIHHFL